MANGSDPPGEPVHAPRWARHSSRRRGTGSRLPIPLPAGGKCRRRCALRTIPDQGALAAPSDERHRKRGRALPPQAGTVRRLVHLVHHHASHPSRRASSTRRRLALRAGASYPRQQRRSRQPTTGTRRPPKAPRPGSRPSAAGPEPPRPGQAYTEAPGRGAPGAAGAGTKTARRTPIPAARRRHGRPPHQRSTRNLRGPLGQRPTPPRRGGAQGRAPGQRSARRSPSTPTSSAGQRGTAKLRRSERVPPIQPVGSG